MQKWQENSPPAVHQRNNNKTVTSKFNLENVITSLHLHLHNLGLVTQTKKRPANIQE